jgi:hypothetical protein
MSRGRGCTQIGTTPGVAFRATIKASGDLDLGVVL